MSTVHKNLTGADLHEPKGADTALAGQVYVSNGAGSGSWVAASSVITNTAWVTGNVRLTLDSVAQSGWILGQNGTIGDGSSGATIRANNDTSALFTLLWNNYNNTICAVSGGRGASAAADFAAHKTILLPDMWQRVIGIAGNFTATGQSVRTLGTSVGTETRTLITANLPPYTPAGAVSSVTFPNVSTSNAAGGFVNAIALGTNISTSPLTSVLSPSGQTFAGTPQGGTSTPFSIVPPTIFINIEIKL